MQNSFTNCSPIIADAMLLAPKTLLLFWLPTALLIFALAFWQQSKELVKPSVDRNNEQAPVFISSGNQGWYYQADGSLRYHITSSQQEHAADGEIIMSSVVMQSFDELGQPELELSAGTSRQRGELLLLSDPVHVLRLNATPRIEMNTSTLTVNLSE